MCNSIRVHRLTSVAALVLAAGLCPATTLLRATLDDLIVHSTAIVRAKVVSETTISSGPAISTRLRLQVVERWKGPSEEYLDLIVPGGKFGSTRQHIPGVPSITQNREYVFFLWNGRTRNYQLLGLGQGLFDIRTDEKGQVTVSRGAVDAAVVDPASGKLTREEAIHLKMADFSARLQRQLGGGAAR